MIMKKFIALIAVFLCIFQVACADTMSLPYRRSTIQSDNRTLQLQSETTEKDVMILFPTSFECTDRLGYYRQGAKQIYDYQDYWHSGKDSIFAILRMDITNIGDTQRNFLGNCSVTVVTEEERTFEGFFFQSNYDNFNSGNYKEIYGVDINQQSKRWAIDPADEFAITPYSVGHYIFGCTLPKYLIDSRKNLQMKIVLGGNEYTYNIR